MQLSTEGITYLYLLFLPENIFSYFKAEKSDIIENDIIFVYFCLYDFLA